MQYRKGFVLLLLTITLVSGCALCPPIDLQLKLIMHFDDYMIPLAKAVDVVADKLPPDAKDQEILLAAVKRSGNPDLLKPFEGYVLKARIQDGVGVILLCSPDGKEGIIEDVTCTTRPDTYRPTGSPCTYLLDVKRVCSAP
jgi:hypothetical protein